MRIRYIFYLLFELFVLPFYIYVVDRHILYSILFLSITIIFMLDIYFFYDKGVEVIEKD